MYRVCVVSAGLLLLASFVVSLNSSGDPATARAVSGSATPEATPTEITDLGLDTSIFESAIGSNRSISWSAVPGATKFRLLLDLTLTAVSASDPVCGRASQPATQQLHIDEELPGNTSAFEIPFPPLPPSDAWVVGNFNVSIRAFGPAGHQLGGQGRIGTGSPGPARVCGSETVAPTPRATTVTLPPSGFGSAEIATRAWLPSLLLATMGAGLVLVSLAFRRRASSRRSPQQVRASRSCPAIVE